MSMHDPIADLLTRIRNAQRAGKPDVSAPASSVKVALVKVLKDEGYVADYAVTREGGKARLDVHVLPQGQAFAVARDGAGLTDLVARLQALGPDLVAIEATGGFEQVAAAALAGAPNARLAATGGWEVEKGVERPSYAVAEPSRTDLNIDAVVLMCEQGPKGPIVQLRLYLSGNGPLAPTGVANLKDDPKVELAIDNASHPMELLFADRLDEVSAPIAMHLERGGQPARAVPFGRPGR